MAPQLFLAAGDSDGAPIWVWVILLLILVVGAFGIVLRIRDGHRARKQRKLPPEVQAQRIAAQFDGSDTVIVPNNTTTLTGQQVTGIAWNYGYVFDKEKHEQRSTIKDWHFRRSR